MPKTLTLAGNDYTVAPITTGAAKNIYRNNIDSYDFTVALVAGSLMAGGDSNASIDTVNAMPYFEVYKPLVDAALEVNGLVPAGEPQAAPETEAAGTSDSSMAQ